MLLSDREISKHPIVHLTKSVKQEAYRLVNESECTILENTKQHDSSIRMSLDYAKCARMLNWLYTLVLSTSLSQDHHLV